MKPVVRPDASEQERRVAEIAARYPAPAAVLIREAWALARQAHGAAQRASGEPYLSHVLEVAGILDSLNLDGETIAAAILHDALEEGVLTLEDIRHLLGAGVAHLAEGVSRMGFIREFREQPAHPEPGAEQARLEGLRKLLLAMAEDLRVVVIKLAARVDNMRTLRYLPEATRQRIARETLDIYAPLANRLGIWQIKWELEDLSFRYLEPDRYQEIARHLDERRTDRERYMAEVVERLGQTLAGEGIRAEVTGRPKHIYSIWRKMRRKEIDFHELFDVRAVRVLVNSIKDCYAALGVVHGMWQHIPKEFDDYINNPKGNNYQSLHTAVIGPQAKTLEVQIRTHEMHEHAELGVAAHWVYKEGGKQDSAFEDRIAWLRQLLELKDEPGGARDFIDGFKNEVFHDRVYVLSPKGRVLDLARGATPLDFAYAIHTDVGHRCRGAKVAGSIVPLTYALKSGDQVEILTTRNGQPSRDWLSPHLGYLKTSRARAKVRAWFKQQDLEKTLSAGRDILDRELRRLGAGDVNLDKLARRLRFHRVDELMAALGRGEIGPTHIAGGVQEDVLRQVEPVAKPPSEPRGETSGGVVIDGVGNLMTHLGRCCRPAPPDPIVGYITRGRGVTIHRKACPNVLRLGTEDRSRLIEVAWSSAPGKHYPVDIEMQAYDRQGLLRDISLLLANEKVNVIGINTHTDGDSHTAYMSLTVEVSDLVKLSRILARLGQLPDVIEVRRRK